MSTEAWASSKGDTDGANVSDCGKTLGTFCAVRHYLRLLPGLSLGLRPIKMGAYIRCLSQHSSRLQCMRSHPAKPA